MTTVENNRAFNGASCKLELASADVRQAAAGWDIWENDGSAPFVYDYDQTVSIFVEAGRARITFTSGEAVSIEPGDLVTVFAGASGSWDISEPIRNRYCFQKPAHGDGD